MVTAPRTARAALLALCAVTLGAGCMADNEAPQGLGRRQAGGGPRVIFDLDARPLPEIPFPNDLATRLDETSPTGRRLNISLHAETAAEQRIRALANELDGFATYGAISVRFDAPIDTIDLWNRQNDLDPDNDAIYLVDVDPKSPAFGQRIALDVGSGRFPLVLPGTTFFDNDPRAGESNLLYETVAEDLNGDGLLQPEEDTDHDGVLDVPNVFPGGTDPIDDLMTFYEVETHTLTVRPVRPLRETTTYAVVLTRRLRGVDDDPDDGLDAAPIESPFAGVHHARQRQALEPLREVLPALGVELDEVAFAWSFTTQSVTAGLTSVRRGLYGHGPLGWLAEAYPPDIDSILSWRGQRSGGKVPHLLRSEELVDLLGIILGLAFEGQVNDEQVAAISDGLRAIDYFVTGTFETPDFLTDGDGLAAPGNPNDHDEVWRLDPHTGHAVHAPTTVTFFCAVPRQELRPRADEPFPVVLYSHGYSSMRMEMLGFAGIQARRGLAVCSIDAVGHGFALPASIRDNRLVKNLLEAYNLGNALAIFERGRARDLDNDGVVDSGGDFFGQNAVHTRDVLRQSVVDTLMLVRILRSFDGQRRWQLREGEGQVVLDGVAGDFDGDGVVDIGGSEVDYFAWGTSLGGLISSLVATLEPAVVAAAPTVGGAGMLDIGMRTRLGAVRRPLWLSVLGPFLLVDRASDADGAVLLRWLVADGVGEARPLIARLEPGELSPGDWIRLTNLRTGVSREARVGPSLELRLNVAADAVSAPVKRAVLGLDALEEPYTFTGNEVVERGWGDPFRIELLDGARRPRRTIDTWQEDAAYQGTIFGAGSTLVAPAAGFGYERQTPGLRRFLGIAQTLIEPADPANYAARWLDPLDFSDVEPQLDPTRRVLVVSTLGDDAVPVATQVALARSAGYLPQEVDPRYGRSPEALLIDNHVIEGVAWLERFGPEVGVNLYDPDDLDRDLDGYAAPSPSQPLRLTVDLPDGSVAGFRMAYIDPDGEHGFFIMSPHKAFDIDTFMANQIAHYFATRGRELSDDLCLEDSSCAFIAPLPEKRVP